MIRNRTLLISLVSELFDVEFRFIRGERMTTPSLVLKRALFIEFSTDATPFTPKHFTNRNKAHWQP